MEKHYCFNGLKHIQQNKMKRFLLSMFIIMLISCHTDSDVIMYNDVKRLIESYMIKYQKYNTFILYRINQQTIEGKNIDGYIIMPYYDKYPNFSKFSNMSVKDVYYDMNMKRIYLDLAFSKVLPTDTRSRKWINNNPHDYVIQGEDTLIDPIINGIYRALYFEVKGDRVIYSFRPDTLILPKMDNSIKFENFR